MSSLHKIESKFRKLNMMYMHVTASDLELKQSKAFLNTLIVNKKPGEMVNDENEDSKLTFSTIGNKN